MSDVLLINNPLSVEQFNPHQCALALLHIDKTPIHLGLISDGVYHSLTIKGYDQKTWEALKALILKKEISCLFISLNLMQLKAELIESHFRKFSLNDSHTTCIIPICSLLSEHLNLDLKASVIFDLLPLLDEQHTIGNYYAYPKQSCLSLIKYTQQDVLAHIRTLKA